MTKHDRGAPPQPGRGRSALRRWLRRLAIAAGLLFLAAAGFVLWVYFACFATPPPLEGTPAILAEKIVADPDGRQRLGKAWFRADPGCSQLYVEGDPFTIGYANAALTADYLELQERSLIQSARTALRSDLAFAAVTLFVLVNNRNLPSYVPLEYQLEILGLSRGGRDPFPAFGPRYHRILNYHAAHDIGHLVMDRPVLGCTAFAVADAMTRDGHCIVGRNFDFEAGRHFDENKITGLYRPAKGHAFISVSWPGMAGAVTGMNAERLYCSINGAQSQDRANIGRPVALVVREVLQYARDLEDAIHIVRAAPVFVADAYLLVDGKTSRAAVVEKTPRTSAVRRMEGGALLLANHFESPELAGDAANAAFMRDGTSVARGRRLAELIAARRGAIDPAAAAEILRDRKASGGKTVAAGNRGTINPVICTHAVVADLTAGVLWVSRGPHQLGRFEAFSIEKFGQQAAPPIPEDPALAEGLPARLTKARALLAAVEKEWSATGRLSPAATAAVSEALELNPGDPLAHDLLGRELEAAGRHEQAWENYRAALEGEPPFREDRVRMQAALQRLKAR